MFNGRSMVVRERDYITLEEFYSINIFFVD